MTEHNKWAEWVMYILTGLTVTAQVTTRKIRGMLSLKEEYEKQMKQILGSSYNDELLRLMFTAPYLKIELLEKRKMAHRQTASSWLNKLTAAELLKPQKIGRTTYFINYRLMDLLISD